MKVLVLTQKVDQNDPGLGFFHEWIRALASQLTLLTVICLEGGEFNLPANVEVRSLGKESGRSRVKYLFNFYRFIWQQQHRYDVVFVHMNPEYIILAGWWWWLVGKRVFLWYNHRSGGWIARLAVCFSRRVFYTADFSFASSFKKGKQMSAGIDTERYQPNQAITRVPQSILYLGRISPVKNTLIFIAALEQLSQQGLNFSAKIYGDPPERDEWYYQQVLAGSRLLEESKKLSWYHSVSPLDTVTVYNQNEIFVNLTQTGSFDKTILEAMACGNLVVVSNKSFAKILPAVFMFEEKDSNSLTDRLRFVSLLTPDQKFFYRQPFRDYVLTYHSLKVLISQLLQSFSDE